MKAALYVADDFVIEQFESKSTSHTGTGIKCQVTETAQQVQAEVWLSLDIG